MDGSGPYKMRRGFFDKPAQGPNLTSFCAVDRNLPKEAFKELPSQGGDLHGVPVAAPRPKRAFDAKLLPKAFREGSVYVPSADGVEENLLVMLHGRGDRPEPYAQLARKMALPQTSALAISGPLPVPFTENGKAWFQASRPPPQKSKEQKGHSASPLLLRKRRKPFQPASRQFHAISARRGGIQALCSITNRRSVPVYLATHIAVLR